MISIRRLQSKNMQLLQRRWYAVKELAWCAPRDASANHRNSMGVNSNESDLEPIERFGIVAAMSQSDRIIGIDGRLPWNIPEDRTHFKELTKNKVVIIGRRTFEEEPSKCHINHAAACIVISRTMHDEHDTSDIPVHVARSFPEALHNARLLVNSLDLECKYPNERLYCWVAGGERLYHQALLHQNAVKLCVTVVDVVVDTAGKSVEDIARFPAKYRWDNKFRETGREDMLALSDGKEIKYSILEFERIKGVR